MSSGEPPGGNPDPVLAPDKDAPGGVADATVPGPFPRGAAIAVAVATLFLLVVLAPLPDAPAVDAGAALTRFLEGDVLTGTWRVEGISGEHELRVVPDPEDEGCRLVERAHEGDAGSWRPLPARFVAGLLAPGDAARFARSYRLADAPRWVQGPSGVRRAEATWVPRVSRGGETARRAWIDPTSGKVVAVEDLSYVGNVIRRAERTGPVADMPTGPVEGCRPEPGAGRRHAPDLDAVAARAPFALLVPRRVPEGYELVAAGLRGAPRDRREEDDEAAPRRRLAYLVYGDGLGLISVGMGEREDMDAFERAMETMRAEREDPDACPTLPGAERPVSANGLVVRRRRDRCRTVLRVDGLHGLTVVLMAQNELPEDEYVRMVLSLAPRPEAPPREQDPR